MSKKSINIAIDGYSSCGKSTLAKDLSKHLKYIYLDTGAMYRSVSLYCLRNGIINSSVDENKLLQALDHIHIEFAFSSHTQKYELTLNGENVESQIRGIEVSSWVSKVSKIKAVREKMVKLQQSFAKTKGIIMDGRDIGTKVLPSAELKLFLTANHDIRAKRRYDELISKGEQVSLEEISENIKLRDYEDTHRNESPLIQAKDAIVIDNSNMTVKEQLQLAIKLAEERIK